MGNQHTNHNGTYLDPKWVERIARDLEDLPIHTQGCPDDCTTCIAAGLLRELNIAALWFRYAAEKVA